MQLLTDKLSQTADRLKATNSRLAALIELNVQLASERDPRVLLEKVCNGARRLLCSKFAVLAIANRSGAGTLFHNTSGIDFCKTANFSPNVDAGLLGRVYRERQSLRLSSQDGGPVDVGLPGDYPAARSVLAAPLASLTRNYGWLCLADKVGSEAFDDDEERILSVLCAQAGRIYENGSLYLEVQSQAAQLRIEMDERERALTSLRTSEELFSSTVL